MTPERPADARRSPSLLRIGAGLMLAALLGVVVWGYLGNDGGQHASRTAAMPQAAAPQAATPAAAAPAPAAIKPPPVSPPAAAPPVPSAAPAADAAEPKPNEALAASGGVRGVVKAREEVLFSAKIAARIASMPFKEGQRFGKGSVLVAFDCSRLRAEANAAWAANRASRQILKQSQELDSYNAIGKNEVQIAQAKAEQTGAEATALETQVRDCTITAPFSGIVVEKMAHEHETAAPGAQLTRVLDDSELEVHLIAPSAWLAWLKPGSVFRFKVDETGRTHAGRVARLGAAVDPVSQTVKVVGVFTGDRQAVLPGMSGTAEFERQGAARKLP